MVADLTFKPPEIKVSEAPDEGITPEEQDRLRAGTRTPRPYHHDREEIRHVQRGSSEGERPEVNGSDEEEQEGLPWVAGSESGTEADDERPAFVKALPAPHLRPRKGLKTGESDEYTLLTPSQLDDEGRRLPVDYFGDQVQGKQEFRDEEKEEQQKDGK